MRLPTTPRGGKEIPQGRQVLRFRLDNLDVADHLVDDGAVDDEARHVELAWTGGKATGSISSRWRGILAQEGT